MALCPSCGNHLPIPDANDYDFIRPCACGAQLVERSYFNEGKMELREKIKRQLIEELGDPTPAELEAEYKRLGC